MRSIFVLLMTLILSAGCGLEGVVVNTPSDRITEQEAALGLKDALTAGATEGAETLHKVDGYFGNPTIRIPWPEDAQKVANTLRDIGLGNEVDKVVLTINRAAEDAAIQAKPIFINAIKQMTIADAMNILFGGKHAATEYLQRKTTAQLKEAFNPIIQNSLQKVNATRYWEDVITRYNQIPLVQKVNPDLDDYVTEKALEGLFHMVALEEEKIRENPIARTTAIMKKVFGYYDRNK